MCLGGSNTGDILYFTHIDDLFQSILEVIGASGVRLRKWGLFREISLRPIRCAILLPLL